MKVPKYRTLSFKNWEDFQRLVSRDYKGWAFRGQESHKWPLESSLSRYFKSFQVHQDAWVGQEARILRIFKRKAHLLLDHLPDDRDSFQWLAMMQHHGAPTRLLDFSWSPYVAAFFALERATSTAAVWALYPPHLSNRPVRTLRASQKVRKDEVAPWVEGAYEKHFLPNKRRLLVVGEPLVMNQRLIAQSGTFVMPGILDEPINEFVPPSAIVKFELESKLLRRHAMAELYNMNISNATLFPGLDGMARSLAFELEFHWAFDPVTLRKRRGFFVR